MEAVLALSARGQPGHLSKKDLSSTIPTPARPGRLTIPTILADF
jgi:hypothetical protein